VFVCVGDLPEAGPDRDALLLWLMGSPTRARPTSEGKTWPERPSLSRVVSPRSVAIEDVSEWYSTALNPYRSLPTSPRETGRILTSRSPEAI
jgi:hypothetical protein